MMNIGALLLTAGLIFNNAPKNALAHSAAVKTNNSLTTFVELSQYDSIRFDDNVNLNGGTGYFNFYDYFAKPYYTGLADDLLVYITLPNYYITYSGYAELILEVVSAELKCSNNNGDIFTFEMNEEFNSIWICELNDVYWLSGTYRFKSDQVGTWGYNGNYVNIDTFYEQNTGLNFVSLDLNWRLLVSSNNYQVQYASSDINQEVIDVNGLILDLIVMPFSFLSQFLNFNFFPGTPYQFNLSVALMSIIAVVVIFGIIMLVVKFIK